MFQSLNNFNYETRLIYLLPEGGPAVGGRNVGLFVIGDTVWMGGLVSGGG